MKINHLIKFIISFLAIFALAALTFYYWASSTNHPQEDYSQLLENNYPETVGNDSIYSLITYNIGYLSGMTNNRAVKKTKELFDDNLTRVYRQFQSIILTSYAFKRLITFQIVHIILINRMSYKN